MRALVTLEAQQDQAYDPEYHHKLRGAVWERLEDTNYGDMHGDPSEVPFVFSNPFPVKDMNVGDKMKILVSSLHDGLIETFTDQVDEGNEFNIGELHFNVNDVVSFAVDAGEPGTRGTLETSTGVYIPLHRENWDEYGIDVPYNADKIGWSNEHGFDVFLQRVAENVDWKQSQVYGDYLDSPSAYDLFDDFDYKKGYSVDSKVTSQDGGYTYTFIVSKWQFGYTVRNEDHRRWLNILLNSGIGWRNALGFGFVNKVMDNE